MRSFVFPGLGLAFMVVACGSSAVGAADAGPTPDSGPAPDGGCKAGTGVLGFTPSNVDVASLDFSNVGDLVVSSGKTWETDLGGTLGSDNAGNYNYKEITQSNGLKLAVFTVKSITIQSGVTVRVEGADGLVIVATGTIDIQGNLYGNSQFSPSFWLGAGAQNTGAANVAGFGLGGGPAADASGAGVGAGGGGFCGVGGAGGNGSQGGPSYGSTNLVPLYAGSSGGAGFGGVGASGGALQLVAAQSISVSGVIHVGGEGGGNGGVYDPPNSQEASGGGSGGALLLESAAVTVTGTLAANGGGGGQGDGVSGADATANSTPAAGADDGQHGSVGGAGSAGTDVDGKAAGSVAASKTAGGGGGAAGRIRINTLCGTGATISGTLSPSQSTPCATQGALAP